MYKEKILKKRFIKLLIILLLLLIVFILINNNYIVITKYDYINDYVDNFRIIQISDLHNKEYNLYNKIQKLNPNMIVITGDISDKKKYNLIILESTLKDLSKIAPTYYVVGNHEKYLPMNEIDNILNKYNIKKLSNENIQIDKNINLIGVEDTSFRSEEYVISSINQLTKANKLNIVLCHRPELFQKYITTNSDLVLTGHAHGGQWRIPFFYQGIFSPSQGFLPKFTSGIFLENNTTMIVSRGLGNSLFPIRLFNLPEIVVIDLICD